MQILKLATLGLLLSSATAFAQSPTQPAPGGPLPGFPPTTTGASATGGASKAVEQTTAPTAAQCTAGYQPGMNWTRDQFIRACAPINGTVK